MRDQAIRLASSRSVREMAQLVGVSRQTIERFESDPMSVGRRRRARCLAYYSALRRHLAELEELATRLPSLGDDDFPETASAAAE